MLITVIEHLGVAVSAISGVLAAQGKRIDLFGVLVLALVTAFGGGTLRDLLLGSTPVAWLSGPELMTTALITALVTFFAARHWRLPHGLLQIADAVGLAFFAVLGAKKALAFNISYPAAILLGVVTGVAGGMLRDVLLREVPFVLRREMRLYASAAAAGCTLLVLLHAHSTQWATWLGFSTILGLRLAAMRWKISLPDFHTKHDHPSAKS